MLHIDTDVIEFNHICTKSNLCTSGYEHIPQIQQYFCRQFEVRKCASWEFTKQIRAGITVIRVGITVIKAGITVRDGDITKSSTVICVGDATPKYHAGRLAQNTSTCHICSSQPVGDNHPLNHY